jgi:hypothetical protein
VSQILPPGLRGEIGYPTVSAGNARGFTGRLGGLPDLGETTPELRWPLSVAVFDRMTRTSAQVEAVMQAVTLPILSLDWRIKPRKAGEEQVRHVSRDLALPVLGEEAEEPDRTANRFSWPFHLRHALLSLNYGHVFFEQVWDPDVETNRVHLRKLAPRMPATISRLETAPDGGIERVVQHPAGAALEEPVLKVDKIVWYAPRRMGSDWFGTSMLRHAYRDWLIGDRLAAIHAVTLERNGMGVPIARQTEAQAEPGGLEKLAQQLRRFRAGEHAYLTEPYGYEVKLLGVEGSLPDIRSAMEYYDGQVAKSALAQFLQLGTNAAFGSRAIGETFVDFFELAWRAIAKEVADIATDHVVEDIVDLNWGTDEPAPAVVPVFSDPLPQTVLGAVIQLVRAGALAYDDQLDAYVRERLGLPERTEAVILPPGTNVQGNGTTAQGDGQVPSENGQQVGLKGDPPAGPGGTTLGGKGRPTPFNGTAQSPQEIVPGRQLAAGDLPVRASRRELFSHELAAKVDFASMNDQWTDAFDALLTGWGDVRARWVEDLVQQVRGVMSLDGLQAIMLELEDLEQLLVMAMSQTAIDAAADAVLEANAQGVVFSPGLVEADFGPRARTTAQLLAGQVRTSGLGRAVLVSSEPFDGEAVAKDVREHLGGLSDVAAKDLLGGTVTAAQNVGRQHVMSQYPGRVFASELLDSSTCPRCLEIDGTEFASDAAAADAYPAGGYRGCLGGTRCRGTVVKVYTPSPVF